MEILLSEELWNFWRVGAPIPKEQISIYARYAEKLEKAERGVVWSAFVFGIVVGVSLTAAALTVANSV